MRKAGEEIVDQLYHFELHGRRYALRGEITPSIARMVMARAGALRMPLRWTSIPQCWRYERMTRGRRREHYQWNMDIWGEPGVTAEAELIAAALTLLERVGLDHRESHYPMQLSGGGKKVAETMGAVLLHASTRDPLERRDRPRGRSRRDGT